ncbi:hypothetical protein CONLIGDRAFT_694359 [Coniochaeta ligniaria NRRL 30616]|uniref:Aminoglycoside phosphotransferase domain-containing protein n=1 Tax=Coniochaeta ligniaria NRRL 30616 TaxID=1408157 RepID=A0A1J7J666_9PEZI|nr:hypothetical protein CONLIGDRAFT_694359 [Coniochaeta ligniaria NRRL 30616]
MDWDDRFKLDNNAAFLSWIRKYDDARQNRLTDWVSSLHPSRLGCKLATHKLDDSRGAFNMNCKIEFDSGEKWMVRFPMVGKSINADEKVEIEVATMKLVQHRTTIPIPEIKAWGLAADNPLGIGPFLIMDFVEGVSVADIIQTPDARIMREDVSEKTLEAILRQTVNFMLQLSKLSFPSIGSLSSDSTPGEGGFDASIRSRPLTQKAHEYLLEGGVDVLGHRRETFSSTTEYFNHVVDRDLRHLLEQPNSVDDAQDAREKFIYFNVMKTLVARHVLPAHDKGPFKLMCDDFQPTNMIVNNVEDLQIVGVIDWEWSYTAPIQLVNSTPTWLLIQSPNAWASVDQRLDRFKKHLELFTRILEEEETSVLGDDTPEDQRPSQLLKACQNHGRQWFHFLILRGFNGPTCVPFTMLRKETEDWDELAATVRQKDIDAFVRKKMADLEAYDIQLAAMQAQYNAALGGDLEDLDRFLRRNCKLLSLDSRRHEWQSWSCFK